MTEARRRVDNRGNSAESRTDDTHGTRSGRRAITGQAQAAHRHPDLPRDPGGRLLLRGQDAAHTVAGERGQALLPLPSAGVSAKACCWTPSRSCSRATSRCSGGLDVHGHWDWPGFPSCAAAGLRKNRSPICWRRAETCSQGPSSEQRAGSGWRATNDESDPWPGLQLHREPHKVQEGLHRFSDVECSDQNTSSRLCEVIFVATPHFLDESMCPKTLEQPGTTSRCEPGKMSSETHPHRKDRLRHHLHRRAGRGRWSRVARCAWWRSRS